MTPHSEKAEEIVAKCREWFSKYSNKIDHSKRIRLGLLRSDISQALQSAEEKGRMEERERCIKLLENWDCNCQFHEGNHSFEIAKVIREGKEK